MDATYVHARSQVDKWQISGKWKNIYLSYVFFASASSEIESRKAQRVRVDV